MESSEHQSLKTLSNKNKNQSFISNFFTKDLVLDITPLNKNKINIPLIEFLAIN